MGPMTDVGAVSKGIFGKLVENPAALVTLVLAIAGQAIFSIYFQVVNNEQQQAQIIANVQSIKDMRDQIYSMQTPLAARVIKLEDRMDNNAVVFTMRADEIARNIDRLGDQQRRIVESLDTLYSEVSKIPPTLRNKK